MSHNYAIHIDDRVLEVELEPDAEPSRFQARIGDVSHSIEKLCMSAERIQIRVDEEVQTLAVAHAPDGLWLDLRGRTRFVPFAERASRRARKGSTGTNADNTLVTPATPSVVTRILVEVGDDVVEGQGLVVVSAMKMEVTLKAGCAGKVMTVGTEVGAKVSPGDILISLQPTAVAGGASSSSASGEANP